MQINKSHLSGSCNEKGNIRTRGGMLEYGLFLFLFLFLTACTNTAIFSNASDHNYNLNVQSLQRDGIAFLTPSTVTGQEEDKQALAFIFTDTMKVLRPDIRQIALPQTLNAVNSSNMTDDYLQMYVQYSQTGIFKFETLQKIGEVTNTRYVIQIKLAGFEQGSRGRWGLLGFRLLETKHAKIRLFVQIWDTATGTIAWEAVHEMNYATDTYSEENITFRTIVEASAQELVKRLPVLDLAVTPQ